MEHKHQAQDECMAEKIRQCEQVTRMLNKMKIRNKGRGGQGRKCKEGQRKGKERQLGQGSRWDL
eukprot:760400-Hanusia_phi.AAC.4